MSKTTASTGKRDTGRIGTALGSCGRIPCLPFRGGRAAADLGGGSRSFAAVDELEETAGLSVRGLVLIQQGEFPVVECFEELLPRDLLKLLVRLREVEA